MINDIDKAADEIAEAIFQRIETDKTLIKSNIAETVRKELAAMLVSDRQRFADHIYNELLTNNPPVYTSSEDGRIKTPVYSSQKKISVENNLYKEVLRYYRAFQGFESI